MKKNRIFRYLLLVIFSLLFGCICNSLEAKALPGDNSTIAEKAYYRNLFTCYESTSWLKDSLTVGDFSGTLDSLVQGNKGVDALERPFIGKEDSKIGCGTILKNKVANPFSTGYRMTQDTTELRKRLEVAYYAYSGGSRPSSSGNSKICASYPLHWFEEKYIIAGWFGANNEWQTINNGYSYTYNLCVEGDKQTGYTFTTEDCGSSCEDKPISFEKFSKNKLTITKKGVNQWYCTGDECDLTKDTKPLDYSGSDSKESILANVGNEVATILGSSREKSTYKTRSSSTKRMTYISACGAWNPAENKIECQGKSSFDVSFDTAGKSILYKKKFDNNLYKHFSKDKYDASSVKFTELEIYVLYQSYLKEIYGVSSPSCFSSEQYGKGAYRTRLYSADTGYTKFCYFDVADDKKNIKVNGVYTSNKYWGDTFGLQEMLDRLLNLNVTEPPDTLMPTDSGDGSVDDGDGSGGTGSKDPCWNSGIDSMAWVMCPAANNLQHFASGITDFIDTILQTDSSLYNNESGAHTAWEYVRTIANTIMIIFLGVVIFSQLTGVGIDNYGIKKLLPKFILMAVLINLSFLICQLAIDLSNIVGNGAQDLFYGVGNNMLNGVDPSKMNDFISKIVSGVYLAITAGPSVAITIGTIAETGSVMGVVIVLLMLLAIVAAVLMFFVSVAARTVIVIMCAVLAPLALVCYALPNTKPIYKKWFDAFKAALLVYPICGVLIGISYIIKAIALSNNGGLAFIVIAGLAPYLPFFLIPSLLKGAIGSLGTIGNAFGSMANAFKSRAGKLSDSGINSIKNSDQYKNAARLQQERRIRRKAGMDENGHLTKRGEAKARRAQSWLGKRFGMDKMQAAYVATAKKNNEASEEANAALTNARSNFGIAKASAKGEGSAYNYYNDQFIKAAEAGDIQAMNSVLGAASSSGYLKDKQVAKMVRDAQNSGQIKIKDKPGQNPGQAMNTWMRDTASKYGNGFLATDFELKHWMQSGDGGTALGGYGQYAGSSHFDQSDIKPEEIGKMSGDSIAGLVASGIIDSSFAQRALEQNKNLSVDKKIILSAIADGKVSTAGVNPGNAEEFARKLKEDAKKLMQGDASVDTSVITLKGSDPDERKVQAKLDAWKSANPQQVNIVQNFNAGGQQYEDVNVKVRGAAEEGQSFPVHNNPGNSGGQPAPTLPSQPAPKQQPKPGSGVPTISDPFVGDGTMDG